MTPSNQEEGQDMASNQRMDLQALAILPEDAPLDAGSLCQVFGCNPRALGRMVKRGELPPGAKMGGKPIWTAGVLRRHIKARTEHVAQEAEKRRERVHRLMPRRTAS